MTFPNSLVTRPSLDILLLEDYNLDADLVATVLKRTHPEWIINHVSNKAEFVNYLEKNKPDVIVSDYALPSFSGIDAYLVVKDLGIEVPFIILTGQLPESSARECVENGIDDYVLKSSIIRLDHAIQRAIQRKNAERERNQFATKLSNNEKRFKAIFEQAGVALAEFRFDEVLTELGQDHLSKDDKKERIRNLGRFLEITAVNRACLHLFEVEDEITFKAQFDRMFKMSGLRLVLRNATQLADGSRSAEQLIEARTFKGHNRILLVKTVLDPARPHFLTVSFTDMTEVKESEIRVMRIIERLEDTIAARVQDLSELNRKLQSDADERERINDALRNNYIQMTESIIAAKRIQQLVLPKHSEVRAVFDDAFIYMRPKGIVSGDFYWFHSDGEQHWLACVDCTGHGVPGAFMSMLSSKLLNQAVIENGIEDPASILSSIDEYVVKELKQRDAGTLVSTGMDISLCRFMPNEGRMQFAGAYQNLLFKTQKGTELIRGDRHSLGGTFQHESKSYTLHEFSYQKGDTFYMHTDGIVDQFGGPSNKKFSRRRLIEMITSLSDTSMYEQELLIKNRIQDWKGTYEQIDDILIMGIRC